MKGTMAAKAEAMMHSAGRGRKRGKEARGRLSTGENGSSGLALGSSLAVLQQDGNEE